MRTSFIPIRNGGNKNITKEANPVIAAQMSITRLEAMPWNTKGYSNVRILKAKNTEENNSPKKAKEGP